MVELHTRVPMFRMVSPTSMSGPLQMWDVQVLNPKWQLAGSGPSLPGAKPSHCRAFMAWSSGAMHCSCFHYCHKYMILWFHVCHALLGPQLLSQGAQGAQVPGQHSWKPGGRACLSIVILFSCISFSSTMLRRIKSTSNLFEKFSTIARCFFRLP